MSGYTPVFNTVFEGSLCGRYPDTAAWMFFLALADWKGEVDKTPEFIATITGMPLSDLLGCIERFMQPDLRSRSQAEEGRKLALIDPNRSWGWRVVNIQAYRDKASGREQVADGRNAEKVRRYKERHRQTPADTEGHSQTPTHTADSYSDKNKTAGAKDAPLVLHASLPQESWIEWLAHRREKRLSMSPRALNKQLKLLAEYPTAIQREMIDTSINAGWEGLFRPKGKAQKPQGSSEWT